MLSPIDRRLRPLRLALPARLRLVAVADAVGSIRGRVDAARPPAAAASGGRRWRRLGAPTERERTDRTRSVVYLRSGAARRVRADRAGPRGDGSAQRDVRPARARRSRPARRSISRTATASTTTCSRSRRPRGSTWAATRPAARSRSASIGPGIVRVFCDIHSHMNAFILVFSHPFFAMTDAEGRYRIDNVPPGTYSVVAWNEGVPSEPTRGHGSRRRRDRARFHACDEELLSSLRSRIFLASALLAVLSIGVAIYLVSAAVDARGREARCSARSSRPARSSNSCGRRAPRPSR